MNVPGANNTPPEITGAQKITLYVDPARRISYARHRHALPKIFCGGMTFIFPVGAEGFRRSGSSTLGIHKYLGRGYVDVQVIHRDEAHIELTGIFPGLTSVKNMQDCITILTMPGIKYLYVPGVFAHVQTVFVETYDFQHDPEDRTHSISYSITLVRTTTGKKVDDKAIALNDLGANGPTRDAGANVKGLSERVVTVNDDMQTFRAVADQVYGDADKWRTLIDLNSDVIQQYNNRLVGPTYSLMPDFQLVNLRLEIGTRLRY
jgi:hypothetical protein